MPEIKNTFTGGKMNKDLDERIIPNGQYRHAMNIKVSSSDDSSVGTVQNLLGNYRVEDLVPVDYTCIATIANEKTNCLYWFVTNSQTFKHAILQYNIIEEQSTIVLLDTDNSVLKFTENIITGINIIDDLLFWTDNNSEPKKINIKNCIQGSKEANPIRTSIDIAAHTKLMVDGVDKGFIKEEHITVIRKNPKIAPSIEINKPTELNTPRLFEQVFPRFSFRYKYEDGEYSSFGPFTDVVFNPVYTGDYDKNNFYSIKESYNTAMLNNIESIKIHKFISNDIPDDVVQVEILYKEEGSSVVFSIKTINYDDDEWANNEYVLKSETIFAAIPENQLLRSWDNVPKKALAQEITGNRVVYGNYTQNYDLLGFNNFKVKPKIEARYDLRPFNDDFSKSGIPSLKSQREYQLGLVFGDKYGRETPVFTSEDGGVSIPYIDTARDIGLSASSSLSFSFNLNCFRPKWADYYKVYVKETSGDYYNLIMNKAYAQTSLNVFDNEEDRVWLSFPSADRNKVSEDSYLILKKKDEASQIRIENKFKILDISNEAPDAVKFDYVSLGEATQNQLGGDNYLEENSTSTALFENAINRIDKINNGEGVDLIHVRRDSWINTTGGGSLTDDGDNRNMYVDNIYITWKAPGANAEKYKVVSIFVLNNVYQIKLNRKILKRDAEMAKNLDTTNFPSNDLKADLIFSCERKIEKDLDEFSGKFFVQIVVGSVVKKEQTTAELLSNFSTSALQPIHWFMDTQENGADPSLGIINSQPNNPDLDPGSKSYDLPSYSISSGPSVGYNGVSADWILLAQQLGGNKERGFFIDNMAFASGQADKNNYAKESGETWKGWRAYYPSHPVWTQLTDAQGTPIFDTFGWTKSGSIGGNPNNTSYQPLDPAYYNPRPFGGVSYPVDEAKNINGLEGFITTDISHIRTRTIAPDGTINYFNDDVGYRAWKNNDVRINSYSANPYDGVEDDGQTGKFFMHISFLGPGKDLVSIDAFDNLSAGEVQTFGEKSVGNFMQGIWGGGVFGDPLSNNGAGSIVEMEGNYRDDDTPRESPPRAGMTGVNGGQGYDGEFGFEHDNQWNPLYGEDDPNVLEEITSFLQNLQQAGKTFRFSTNGEYLNDAVEGFVIKSVQVKKLYNHTPWKAQYKWDGSGTPGAVKTGDGLVTCGNSVDEAAIAWAETIDNSSPNGDPALFTIFKDTVIRFGSKHNRRTVYIVELDKDPGAAGSAITNGGELDIDSSVDIEFITTDPNSLLKDIIERPAIWETEPKEKSGLDIYYEASQAYSFKLNEKTNENFAPIGCKVEILLDQARNGQHVITDDIVLESWDGVEITVSDPGFNVQKIDLTGVLQNIDYTSAQIRFFRKDGSYTTTRLTGLPLPQSTDYVKIFALDPTLDVSMEQGLSYYNCFSFGNGVESNRVRDDFNAPEIKNGVKASITIDQEYKEEHRKHGLIFSGIYNSTSGVNNTNQFIIAENITKDLNPTYGSIQKLFQRRISLVTFCEDKVVSITSNKDALFNADGNSQLVSTNAVLGDATPFSGDYGISKNPESFAKESYRAYFTDKQRGAVLRLSMDGLTPISDAGMNDYFRDNLRVTGEIIGTYDGHSKNYNLTLRGRKPGDNIINNSSIGDGVSSIQGFVPTNIVIDGNLTQIDPLVLAGFDIADNLTSNRQLHTTATLTNYPFIPANFYPETSSSSDVTVSNSIFSTANYSSGQIFNQNFHGVSNSWLNGAIGDPLGNGDAGNTTEDQQYRIKTTYPFTRFSGQQYPDATNSVSGNVTGFSGDIYWYDGTWDSTLGMNNAYFPVNQPTPDGNGTNTSNTQGCEDNTEGIVFDRVHENKGVILPGDHQPAPPPNPPGSGTMQTNNTKVPNTVLLHTNTINGINDQPYVNMKDNTIINGEQIRLIFTFKNNADQDPLGTVTTPAARRVKITLWDGFDLATRVAVPDSLVFDPSTSTITTSLPYGDYSDNPFPSSSTFKIGYATTASVEFPTMDSTNTGGDYEQQHEVYFKFNDDTEEEKILIQDLQVQIQILDDNNVFWRWGVLKAFQMRKNYRLTTPELIQTTITFNGDGLPPVSVQPFAEIVYGGMADWSLDFYETAYPGGIVTNPNLVDFGANMLSFYGTEYIGNLVTGTQDDGNTETWTESPDGPGGGSNGTTGYNDYSDGLKTVNDKFNFTGTDPLGVAGEAVLKQSYTTITNNWYMLDLDVHNSSFSGDLPRLLDFEVDFFHTIESHNYNGQPVDIYRCVFQGDDTIDTLKILFYANTVVKVRTINMLDISATYTGGTHTNGDWSLNYNTTNNPNPINSLSQPTVWIETNGLEFNTAMGDGFYTSAFQNLPAQTPITADGYEFKFTVSNYGGYPTGGGLSFYCIGENEGMWLNIGILSDGDYDVSGNFDGGTYTVNRTTPGGAIFSSGVTSAASTQTAQRDIINFFTTGFIGCVSNISLTDKTNYFIGGSAGSFDFMGFDNTLQTYIDFQNVGDGQIVFTDSPILGASGEQVQIAQLIEKDINNNDYYRLKFDYNIPSGSIGGYYFNGNGKGFRFSGVQVGTGLPGDGFDALYQIGVDNGNTVEIASGELQKTLVLFVEQDLTSGVIDNIALKREFPGFTKQTVSFSENVKGWTSFKSFTPEQGVSLSSQYFTTNLGGLWQHDDENQPRNTFYNNYENSTVTAILNQSPSSVKIFNTLNYEGSQSKVEQYITTTIDTYDYNNLETYNENEKLGWSAEYIKTDKQEGSVKEFIEKEGKWYNYIKGSSTGVKTSDLSFQGLGVAKIVVP